MFVKNTQKYPKEPFTASLRTFTVLFPMPGKVIVQLSKITLVIRVDPGVKISNRKEKGINTSLARKYIAMYVGSEIVTSYFSMLSIPMFVLRGIVTINVNNTTVVNRMI